MKKKNLTLALASSLACLLAARLPARAQGGDVNFNSVTVENYLYSLNYIEAANWIGTPALDTNYASIYNGLSVYGTSDFFSLLSAYGGLTVSGDVDFLTGNLDFGSLPGNLSAFAWAATSAGTSGTLSEELHSRSALRNRATWSWEVPNTGGTGFDRVMALITNPVLASGLTSVTGGALYTAVPIYINGQQVLTQNASGMSIANGGFNVTSSGNVGIGTASPSARLSIMDTVQGLQTGLSISPYHTPGVVAGTALNAADAVRSIALQTNGGNVGVGTNTPAFTLDVNGTLRTTGVARFDGGASFGKFSDLNYPGMSFLYSDEGGSLNTFHAYRWGAAWRWQHSHSAGDTPQMELGNDNRLTLYNSSWGPGVVTVSLNPMGDSYFSGGGITIAGTPPSSQAVFQRYNDHSNVGIGGHEIINWAGAPWTSARTQLLIYADNPSASTAAVGIMAGTSGNYTSNELRLGSYNITTFVPPMA